MAMRRFWVLPLSALALLAVPQVFAAGGGGGGGGGMSMPSESAPSYDPAAEYTKGATAYITDPPCPGCRKALAAAGVVRAVWPDGEHDRVGLTAW